MLYRFIVIHLFSGFLICLFAQEINRGLISYSLNIDLESSKMEILDYEMLKQGKLVLGFTRPITYHEFKDAMHILQIDGKSLRFNRWNDTITFPDINTVDIDFRGGVGAEYLATTDSAFLTRYQERVPLFTGFVSISRDSAMGFDLKFVLKNLWPYYEDVNHKKSIPANPLSELDFRVFYKAYFSYLGSDILFQCGRGQLSWGVGERGNLLLSDNVSYYDFLKFAFLFKRVKFSTVLANLNAFDQPGAIKSTDTSRVEKPYKSMMVQRLEIQPWSNLVFAISEMTIIYGRPPELGDLNPFILQHNRFQEYHNSLAGIDLVYTPAPGLLLYGEAVSDEIRLSKKKGDDGNNPTTVSYLGGLKFLTGSLLGVLEYVHVAPLMYNYYDPLGRAIDYDYVSYPGTAMKDVKPHAIGHWLPPDSRNLMLTLEWRFSENTRLKLRVENRRHGMYKLDSPYPDPISYTEPPSPTGIVDNRNIITLLPKVSFGNTTLKLNFSLINVKNRNNVTSNARNYYEYGASVFVNLDGFFKSFH